MENSRDHSHDKCEQVTKTSLIKHHEIVVGSAAVNVGTCFAIYLGICFGNCNRTRSTLSLFFHAQLAEQIYVDRVTV